jgi:hypothetical protein
LCCHFFRESLIAPSIAFWRYAQTVVTGWLETFQLVQKLDKGVLTDVIEPNAAADVFNSVADLTLKFPAIAFGKGFGRSVVATAKAAEKVSLLLAPLLELLLARLG